MKKRGVVVGGLVLLILLAVTFGPAGAQQSAKYGGTLEHSLTIALEKASELYLTWSSSL